MNKKYGGIVLLKLSRKDLENIAERVLVSYRNLPEVKRKKMYRVDPELLLTKVLGLNIEYQHLSVDGSILGLTSYEEVGVEVLDCADTDSYFFLDGKTVLVEQDLHNDAAQIGRCNFTLMHEAGHQILRNLFPKEYGSNKQVAAVHYYKHNSERNKPINDWEEWQANTLASAILMPRDLVEYGMFLFGLGKKIKCLNRIADLQTYEKFSAMADFLGTSKSALAIRMKQLNLLEKEYLDNPLAILDI